jgi:hypothetical protein
MIVENDVVMGTFTHRETYLPQLCKSIREHLPHMMFIPQMADLPINANFSELRKKFASTNKRYWLFLDDDIKFLFPDTIRVALTTMIKNKYALVGVYSTFDPEFLDDCSTLVEKEVDWVPGYFQLVDSHLVGHIDADINLPYPNTAIDTTYSVRIRQQGGRIGIAPTYVYHTYKEWGDRPIEDSDPSNQYLHATYGPQYFQWCHGIENIIGNIPWSNV